MHVVYLCHPVSGDVAANVARAERWLRWACQEPNIAPMAPWLEYVRLFAGDDDSDVKARNLNVSRSCVLATRASEVWLVGGRISSGMHEEAKAAEAAGVPVFDWTSIGPEPPSYPPSWAIRFRERFSSLHGDSGGGNGGGNAGG